MDIKVSGRKTTVTDALRAHVDEKIGEALKVFDIEPMTVDVVLRYEKNPSNPNPAIVEVTVRARGSVIRVAEHGADMYAAIDLSAEEKQALLENQPLLENAGLDVADFGGSTVLLRAVPADVEPQNAEDLLVEIADRLLKGSRDALNEHTEWVLHSISCRAAIKAGDKSSPQELMALAEKILSGEVPPFCPHGRPCVLKLTRKELEKQFGRIV